MNLLDFICLFAAGVVFGGLVYMTTVIVNTYFEEKR